MREKNGFTIFLAVLGGISIVFSLVSLGYHADPLTIVLTIIGVTLVALFTIKLPNEFFYIFDHIPAIYVMLKFDWTLVILATSLSLFFMYFQTNDRKVKWFRYFVNLGLNTLAFALCYGTFALVSTEKAGFPIILLIVFVSDICSLILHKLLFISVLGRSSFTKPSNTELGYSGIFILISSIILYRLLQASSPADLALEVVLTVLLLYIFKYTSDHYYKQLKLFTDAKLGYEMCIEAAKQLFFELKLDGTVQSVNSIAVMQLGLTKSEAEGIPFLEMVAHGAVDAQLGLDQARSGLPSSQFIELSRPNGNGLALQASFVPITRNHAVSGIYVIGQLAQAREYKRDGLL